MLPDVKMAWRDLWMGSFVTAVLFSVGKWAIGMYLGRAGVSSTYGAVGSAVVLLLWVYYSAIILLTGAVLTQVRANHRELSPVAPVDLMKPAEPGDIHEART